MRVTWTCGGGLGLPSTTCKCSTIQVPWDCARSLSDRPTARVHSRASPSSRTRDCRRATGSGSGPLRGSWRPKELASFGQKLLCLDKLRSNHNGNVTVTPLEPQDRPMKPSTFRRAALAADGTFACLSGLGLVAQPAAVGERLGSNTPEALGCVGVGLMALGLSTAAEVPRLRSHDPPTLLSSVLGVGWVTGSAVLVLMASGGSWPSPCSQALVGAVTALVLVRASLRLIVLRRPASVPRLSGTYRIYLQAGPESGARTDATHYGGLP